MKKISYNIIALLPFLTTYCLSIGLLQAQENTFSKQPFADTTIKSLKIGDKVPNIFITKILRFKSKQAYIGDFRNQLLILNFWDTYCGSCIEALPKLDSLQKLFGGKIQIMPVTYQPEALVNDFFKKNNYIKGIQLPCIVEDKVLRAYFKHQLISHEVWIYKGIVRAITGSEYITSDNIQEILDGKMTNWPLKDDEFHFNPKKFLFHLTDANKFNKKADFNSHSGITGYRNGIAFGGLHYDSLLHRTYFYNFSIVDAYTSILTGVDRKDFIVGANRIVLKVKNPADYIYSSENSISQEEWNENHKFCYEMVTSKSMEKKERMQLIINDLNERLGLRGAFEKRLIKCLVLIENKNSKKIDSINIIKKGIEYTLDQLAFFELDSKQIYPPAINEISYKGKIKIEPTDDLNNLRSQLQLYGFDLIEANREIEVLVIEEDNYMPN